MTAIVTDRPQARNDARDDGHGAVPTPRWAGLTGASPSAARETRVEEPEPATVRAAMAGDIAAFEQLVRAYQDPVWRFLIRLLGDRALAEDVTQDTFVRLYRKLPTFGFQAKFSTWLLQVARNAGIDALRSRARRDGLVEALAVPARHVAPSSDLGLGFEIESALATLSKKHREAILLIDALGFTYREAGEVLGVPAGTVKSRVFLGREQIHTWFAAQETNDEV